jgi:hypothetical protein
MELYIKWSFWLGVVGLAIHMIRMVFTTYPRREEWSLGADVVRVFLTGFFLVWAWFLIYH